VADDGVPVLGAFCVVRQPGVVGPGPLELGEDAAVDLGAGVRADLLLDRPAGDLVTEAEHRTVSHEQARGDGFVEGHRGRSGDGVEQGGLDPLADQGGGVEHLSPRRRQPSGAGEHRVARGRGQPLTFGAQDLADEERVAAGQRVHGVRLVTRRLGQRGDGGGRERW
jgi:hypothetical protein